MREFWTKEQEAALRKYWNKPCNLKAYAHLFGDRSLKAIVAHARKYMHLGPRPHPSRCPGWSWGLIKAELKKGGPGTAPELVRRTGLSPSAVAKCFASANPGPNGEVHISDYQKRSNGGKPVAVYSFGSGENVEKPAPYTNSEKYHMIRARKQKKANPFSIVVNQVLNAPALDLSRQERGRYESRIHRMEEAA